MIRFLFRLLATISLAVAVIMAVLDATRTVAAGSLVTTPLGTSWLAVSPATLESTQAAVRNLAASRAVGSRGTYSFSNCRASSCSA